MAENKKINYVLINEEYIDLLEKLQRNLSLQYSLNNILSNCPEDQINKNSLIVDTDSYISSLLTDLKNIIIDDIKVFAQNLNFNERKLINRILETSSIPSLPVVFKDLNIQVEKIHSRLVELIDKYKDIDWDLFNNNLKKEGLMNPLPTEIDEIRQSRNKIIFTLDDERRNLKNTFEIIKSEINLYNQKNNQYEEIITRLNEEKELLTKSFKNEISNITEKHQNNIKSFELDIEKFRKSTELLNTAVDAGLKALSDLNSRTQKMDTEFYNIIKDKTSEIDNVLDLQKTELINKFNTIESELTAEENSIRNTHKDFINLVSKSGIYGLTQNYDMKAKEEKKEYQTYRKYTSWSIIAAIISTLIVFIVALIEHAFTQKDTSYLLLISRLSISIMFFVLAFYLSKQAAKHYECYQENHRTFLQLAALEPFMARMSEEEQKTIRKGLVPTYFNQNSDTKFASKGDEIGIPADFKSSIDKIIELGKSLKDNGADSSKAS